MIHATAGRLPARVVEHRKQHLHTASGEKPPQVKETPGAIELGRHTNSVISAFIALLAIIGSSLLIKKYIYPSKTVLGTK